MTEPSITSSAGKARKVLLTGAGGFIGSHLTEAAVRAGHRVRAMVRYTSSGSAGWLENSPLKDEIEIVRGDIRDLESVSKAAKGCDTIFHLAALIGIPYSYECPLSYIRVNVEGTYNVLEAARSNGASNVLITSTSETYGTAQYVPIDEDHPCVGQSPYAATKIAADQLALSYHRSFGLPVKIVRPFNTYGPRQSARAVIPTIIGQLLAGRRELKLGHLTPTRDLTFVEDTVRAFLDIAASDQCVGLATNIGMDAEISVLDLANMIADLMGVEVTPLTDDTRVRPTASEVERLRCDNRRLLKRTAWRPAFDLRTGLEATVNWFREGGPVRGAESYTT
jgi:NAD dependent epimerase/dehydratase